MPAPRACLVLDFDGTILDTELPIYRAWATIWAEHGHELELSSWQDIVGTAGGFDPQAELESRLGRGLAPAALDRCRALRNEFQRGALPRSGILDWLDDASALGVPVGIASSSPPEWVEAHLDELGIADRFACVVGCAGSVPAKPDPTSYRRACAALGGDPSYSVAVEDSRHGVAAARAAGLYVVVVPHELTAGTDLSAADELLGSLDELDLASALDRAARRDRRSA